MSETETTTKPRFSRNRLISLLRSMHEAPAKEVQVSESNECNKENSNVIEGQTGEHIKEGECCSETEDNAKNSNEKSAECDGNNHGDVWESPVRVLDGCNLFSLEPIFGKYMIEEYIEKDGKYYRTCSSEDATQEGKSENCSYSVKGTVEAEAKADLAEFMPDKADTDCDDEEYGSVNVVDDESDDDSEDEGDDLIEEEEDEDSDDDSEDEGDDLIEEEEDEDSDDDSEDEGDELIEEEEDEDSDDDSEDEGEELIEEEEDEDSDEEGSEKYGTLSSLERKEEMLCKDNGNNYIYDNSLCLAGNLLYGWSQTIKCDEDRNFIYDKWISDLEVWERKRLIWLDEMSRLEGFDSSGYKDRTFLVKVNELPLSESISKQPSPSPINVTPPEMSRLEPENFENQNILEESENLPDSPQDLEKRSKRERLHCHKLLHKMGIPNCYEEILEDQSNDDVEVLSISTADLDNHADNDIIDQAESVTKWPRLNYDISVDIALVYQFTDRHLWHRYHGSWKRSKPED